MSADVHIARDQAHLDGLLEAGPGLPEPLPSGEALLWQGAPDWRLLAIHVFHVRPLAAITALFSVLSLAVAAMRGAPPAYLALAMIVPLLAGAAAIGVAALSAWLVARVSLYTVTTARVVLRVGLLVPVNLNIPFSEITDVALRNHAGGSGDLPLRVRSHQRVSYLLLWPHVRPMQFRRIQPMMRAVRDSERAGQALVQALRRAHAGRAAEPAPMMMAAE